MENLEKEIADIEQRLSEKRAALESKQQAGDITETPQDKATLREIVGEKIQEQAPEFQPKSQSQTSDEDTTQIAPPPVTDPPSYLSEELKDKVQDLVNITFQVSLSDAIKKVQSFDNPALMDAFHEVLVDELYNQLLERGKIKKL